MEQFVDINRTFYHLPEDYSNETNRDAIDIAEALAPRMEESFHWDKLLGEHRVIILAEAGAGKTQEIRHATKVLMSKGRYAFFIRLEHIADGLESAFEIGTYQEFQNWLDSSEEGWLLLDSVDEARLKDPKDFEKAIRKIACQISVAIPRAHIVITSRVSAWRPKTDLDFCNAHFPFLNAYEQEEQQDTSEEELFLEGVDTTTEDKRFRDINISKQSEGFKIYSLTNLSKDQIVAFVTARGIKDNSKFLNDIERQDGWAFTARPQDLEELIEFWNDKQRVGTRYELIEHSVKRRLKERDQDRAEAKPFRLDKARIGVRLLAAACVLMNESTIRVPDGTNNTKGVDVKSVLTDWDDRECQILLSRPIFDEAIYGTVRFHHRSVREYLAAEWFSEVLKISGSRQKIESLFFRTQYDIEVIVPSMKPILSWLVLFDDKIMGKVNKHEPEIILQGGDPSRLPLEIRREILISVCQNIDSGNSYRSIEDKASIDRFALPDMADEIVNMLEKYKGNKDVTYYLLSLIWQGRIKEALPIAKTFALNHETEQYVRITALKILKEIGTKEDLDEVVDVFISNEEQRDRSFFAELIDGLKANIISVKQIVKGIENVQENTRYGHDSLGYSLSRFVKRSDSNVVSNLVIEIDKFLRQEPVVERRYCEISRQFGWLLPISKKAIEKLIAVRDSAAFSSESLFVLMQLPTLNEYNDFDSESITLDISELVADWKELNYALFWKTVEKTRESLDIRREIPLTNYWQVYTTRHYWKFNFNNFEDIVADITNRRLLDDRLVALSLAFQLYKDNKRPKNWLRAIKKSVTNENDLNKRLNELLHPPLQVEEERRWKQHEAQWKRQDKKREIVRQKDHAQNLKWLKGNYQKLRSNGLERGHISDAQYFMYHRMHGLGGNFSASLTNGNWQALVKDYGTEVATAFRDGLVNYWRTYTPQLLSEVGENSKILKENEFGLSGLEIESAETPDWPQGLSQEETERACRYAFHELNRFPNWFPRLYKKFPDTIHQSVINEIRWELENGSPDSSRLYILSKVSWECEWLWDGIASKLLQAIEVEPGNANDLGNVLKMIEGSSTVSDNDLAAFAARKCNSIISWQNSSYWYATWIGIDPESALQSFDSHLAKLYVQSKDDAKNLAMKTIVNLVGERRSAKSLREAVKSPRHLKNLYTLMYQYIRVEEDIDRANKGVYSPGLRDDAQEARDGLFSMLKNIPGKESYLAMVELSKTHPVQGYHNWIMRSAKERAELDADSITWTAERFVDFAKTVESTPSNHRELFDLGVQRLLDLKYELEESDESIASTLLKENEETGIRKVIANWCRNRSAGRYIISQEEELADAKRPDCRFLSSTFDAPVPVQGFLIELF